MPPPSLLEQHIAQVITAANGWIGFDQFMQLALYQPGLGYYSGGLPKIGTMPEGGSDFVTAPEMSPLFGEVLAVQVAQALEHTGTHEVWEFGAGTGALAAQLLQALGERVTRYTIVDLSGDLRARQQQRLAPWGDKVRWLDALPEQFEGVVVGNELLDAMPVQLLVRLDGVWHERGVGWTGSAFAWADKPTTLRPPVEVEGEHDYLTELHAQGEAFIHTLGAQLVRGAVLLIDYGFGENEYYHPQRAMGTVMCHRAHRADADPLVDVGEKDITAHVNFTAMAVAAQDAGFEVLGYTSQGHFLVNCGLLSKMEQLPLAPRAMATKLMMEHEMGELFKVLLLTKGAPWPAVGFTHGDRTHRL